MNEENSKLSDTQNYSGSGKTESLRPLFLQQMQGSTNQQNQQQI